VSTIRFIVFVFCFFYSRFWYVTIGVINLIWITFRLATILSVRFRAIVMRWKAGDIKSNHTHHRMDNDCIDYICHVYPHPDWHVLSQLADNTDAVAFQKILEGLCHRLSLKHGTMERRLTVPDVMCIDQHQPQGMKKFFIANSEGLRIPDMFTNI
jgi:hypothetical protein